MSLLPGSRVYINTIDCCLLFNVTTFTTRPQQWKALIFKEIEHFDDHRKKFRFLLTVLIAKMRNTSFLLCLQYCGVECVRTKCHWSNFGSCVMQFCTSRNSYKFNLVFFENEQIKNVDVIFMTLNLIFRTPTCNLIMDIAIYSVFHLFV